MSYVLCQQHLSLKIVLIYIYTIYIYRPSRTTQTLKQDGSHEPECIHVLGLRVKTSAIGKQTFFSCIVRSYRLSEGTWSTVHKETTNSQRHAWKTSLEDSMATTLLETLLEDTLGKTLVRHYWPTLLQDTLRRHSWQTLPLQRHKKTKKNASATKSPAQHNAITNATESRPQQNHLLKHSCQRKQHHQRNKITNTTTSPAQRNHHQTNH